MCRLTMHKEITIQVNTEVSTVILLLLLRTECYDIYTVYMNRSLALKSFSKNENKKRWLSQNSNSRSFLIWEVVNQHQTFQGQVLYHIVYMCQLSYLTILIYSIKLNKFMWNYNWGDIIISHTDQSQFNITQISTWINKLGGQCIINENKCSLTDSSCQTSM